MDRNLQIITEIAATCCERLFSDYAVTVQRSDAAEPGEDDNLHLCGIIGFTGEEMRGTLMLATTREPLGLSNPSGDVALRDWIAELTNQLLGRIKNQLLGYGVTLYLSTPIVLRGQCIAPVSRQELRPLLFRSDNGLIAAWIEVEMTVGLELPDTPSAEGVAVVEGDALLF